MKVSQYFHFSNVGLHDTNIILNMTKILFVSIAPNNIFVASTNSLLTTFNKVYLIVGVTICFLSYLKIIFI